MTVALESWDTRITRAEELAHQAEPTKEILTFYARLLMTQKKIDEFLRRRQGWLPAGSLTEDLSIIRESLPAFFRTVEVNGAIPLGEERPTKVGYSHSRI